jgi:uncharacterized membrane protein YbhN (UPF0104 family)
MGILSFFGLQKKKVKIGEPEAPIWQGNVANKEKLTTDDAKFLFDQAEKFLKDSVENSNLIVTRTSSLVTLLVGSLIALIGYVISKFNLQRFDALTITAMIGMVYVYILVYYAFENTKPRVYLIPGALPKDLFADAFFVEGIENEKRIIHFYISETENYQFKIEKNNELNKIRWKRYANLLKATVLSPLVLAAAYFITWFLLLYQSHHS